MTDSRFLKLRLLRFCIWAVLMTVTASIVGWYYPRKAFYVPCIFMALIAPMVLLPMKNKPEDTDAR
jgi:sugar phosphate permease